MTQAPAHTKPSEHARAARRRRPSPREQGVALVMVLTVIAVITVFVSEMMKNTSTEFQVSVSQRDRLKAEYLARSGTNLTRLLIHSEPLINNGVIQMLMNALIGHSAQQLNVWQFANTILAPFANYNDAKLSSTGTGIDFNQMQGLKDTGGSFKIVAFPENSMINVNNPVYTTDPEAAKRMAMELYSMMGGFLPQSPYDALFDKLDPDGQQTGRLDIVSDIIDWWDADEQKTVFNPGALTVTPGGGEDDIYSRFNDPYRVKNAPFDSLEELRMVRGISDDFWATFVQKNPDDPRSRQITIYGAGRINPNEAPADVLLARVCSDTTAQLQPLCQDPMQASMFVTLLGMVRSFAPIPWFGTPKDFVDFVQGTGQLYSMIAMLAPPTGGQKGLWQAQLPADAVTRITNSMAMKAQIFTIQITARVGHSTVRTNTVVNFDSSWHPPPPNAGGPTGLGAIHYYRLD